MQMRECLRCCPTQALLQRAVGIEDGMGYMEPPRQYQPVRHCLGRVLLSAGQPAEAEQVARLALFRHQALFHELSP